jgi:hypothetical protein
VHPRLSDLDDKQGSIVIERALWGGHLPLTKPAAGHLLHHTHRLGYTGLSALHQPFGPYTSSYALQLQQGGALLVRA